MVYDPTLYSRRVRIRFAILAVLAIFDPSGHVRRAADLARSMEGECYYRPKPWEGWLRWPAGTKRPIYGVDHPRFHYVRDLTDPKWSQPFSLTMFGETTFYSIAWPDRGLAWDPWRGYHALDVAAFRDELAGRLRT